MIEASTTPPDAPAEVPARGSRIWRIVLFVVAVQLAVVALGMVFFSALGLANDGPGGCGGG